MGKTTKASLKNAGMKFVGESAPESDIVALLKPETAGLLNEFCRAHHDASPETVIDRAVLAFIAHK